MFSDIEARREMAGIDQVELCKRAGVHPTTYTARKSGRSSMRETTLKRLEGALSDLIAEKRDQIIEAQQQEARHAVG